MWQNIGRLLESNLGFSAKINEKIHLSSGDIHHTWKIYYGDTPVFVKSNLREFLPNFKNEAEQLEMLAKSQTIRTPRVLGIGNSKDASFLLLEFLPVQPFTPHSAYCFGQQLARLHQWEEQPSYGFDFDTQIDTTPQLNSWEKRWNHFYAEKRIGFQLQLASEKGMVFGDIDEITQIITHRLADHNPQPSLLHGNLWPKNCAAIGQSEGTVFDPACYWGDRECDIAMLPLCTAVPVNIFDGYQSVWPLSDKFLSRQPIYQLYFFLNRCNLFGGEENYLEVRKIIDDLLATP